MATKKIDYMGVPIVVEFEKGEWRPDSSSPIPNMGYLMYADYGYVEGTYTGADEEEWDVFVGPDHTAETVYILPIFVAEEDVSTTAEPWRNQGQAPYDEMKFLFGFSDQEEAAKFARSQYPDYIRGRGDILQAMTVDLFKETIEQGTPMAEKMDRQEEVAREGDEPDPEDHNEEELEMYEYQRPDQI